MKYSLLLPLFSLLVYAVSSNPPQVDSGFSLLQEQMLSEGVVYQKFSREEPAFSIDVLEVDLTVPENGFLAWRIGGLKPTSAHFFDAEEQGHKVLAGMNADFFSFQSTLTVGNQVTNGEWVMGVPSYRSHMLVDRHNRVRFQAVSFSGKVMAEAGASGNLTGVNRFRSNEQAMFYNTSYGCDEARSDSTGVELVLRLIEGQSWSAGDTLRVVVEEKARGDATLWEAVSVISVGERHPDYSFYASVGEKDTLRLILGFDDPHLTGIRQVVGGAGMILLEGVEVHASNRENERLPEAFLTNRHPRTLVASNRTGDKVWLITVDGRQEASVGMSFPEMAEFVRFLGGWNAVNLDGGGSTTMVVDGRVVNRPSDPLGERAVANAIFVLVKGE